MLKSLGNSKLSRNPLLFFLNLEGKSKNFHMKTLYHFLKKCFKDFHKKWVVPHKLFLTNWRNLLTFHPKSTSQRMQFSSVKLEIRRHHCDLFGQWKRHSFQKRIDTHAPNCSSFSSEYSLGSRRIPQQKPKRN